MTTTGVSRVTRPLADATGRSEEEIKVALAVAAVTAVLMAVLRLIAFLGDLGTLVVGRSKK